MSSWRLLVHTESHTVPRAEVVVVGGDTDTNARVFGLVVDAGTRNHLGASAATHYSDAVGGIGGGFAHYTTGEAYPTPCLDLGVWFVSGSVMPPVESVGHVVIVLDWNRPHAMMDELAQWWQVVASAWAGVDATVVVANSRLVDSLKYPPQTGEYIQFALRTACLGMGAAVVYAADTLGLLGDVVAKSLGWYDGEVAPVLGDDELVIPHGWDSVAKVELLRAGVCGNMVQPTIGEELLHQFHEKVPGPAAPQAPEPTPQTESLEAQLQEVYSRMYEAERV